MNNDRRVNLRKILSNINLSEVENILKNNYKYQPGKPGRPPLSPTGMFLSFILMFLRMESYRDYQAFLKKDQFWRRQLQFKQPPDIGSFTNFLKRIGVKTFEQLFTMVVQQLLDKEFLNIHTIAQDGSILKGNPDDNKGEWGSQSHSQLLVRTRMTPPSSNNYTPQQNLIKLVFQPGFFLETKPLTPLKSEPRCSKTELYLLSKQQKPELNPSIHPGSENTTRKELRSNGSSPDSKNTLTSKNYISMEEKPFNSMLT